MQEDIKNENNMNRIVTQDVLEEISKRVGLIETFALKGDVDGVNKTIFELGEYKNYFNLQNEIDRLKIIWSKYKVSNEFYEALNGFIDKFTMKTEKYVSISEQFKDYYLNKQNKKGLSFLCNELDKLTGGIKPGTICTIAGGPGSMKTTTAVNISYEALKNGYNVCYFSLEETPYNLYSKLLSRVSIDVYNPLSVSEILNKELNVEQEKILFEKVIPYLDSLPGKIEFIGENNLSQYSCFEFENKLNEINEIIKNKTASIKSNNTHEIDLIVVDHIQLLKYQSKDSDEYRTINKFVSFFRRQSLNFLNKKREVVVILLSQVNREGVAYSRKHDGQYLMQHMAEASEVERASSYIITVYTDPMVQITKQIKLGAVKLRGSALPTNIITATADGEFYQVGDSVLPDNDYSSMNLDLGQSYQAPTMTQEELLDLLNV